MSKFKGLYGFSISESSEQQIKDHLQEIEQLLYFTQGLSPDERQRLPKVNDRNFPKVDNALLVVDHAPQILPGFVDAAGYKNSYRLLRQLLWLEVGMKKLLERVRDSRMIVGSNLLAEAGMINRVREDAIGAEVPGISSVFDRLQKTYQYRSPGSSGENQTEEDAQSPVEEAGSMELLKAAQTEPEPDASVEAPVHPAKAS
jgi:hypothetical protein